MTENDLLKQLPEYVDSFLDIWVRKMKEAGYLKDTTAKREDCILSFEGFLNPVLEYLKKNPEKPSFPELLENRDNWAGQLIDFGRRHRARGINTALFLGNFQCLIQSIEEILLSLKASEEIRLKAILKVRRFSDGAITLILSEWSDMEQTETVQLLAETNRELTLKKNKYENILEATSDLVLVCDHSGVVTEANSAARFKLQKPDLIGSSLSNILGLQYEAMEKVIEKYQLNQCHEVSFPVINAIYQMQLIPLQTVSLATKGYMVLLSDITSIARQRELLKDEISEHSVALANAEKQYVSLFQNAVDCIFLANHNFNIIESNSSACRLFDRTAAEFDGMSFHDLFVGFTHENFLEELNNLEIDQAWKGELYGKKPDNTLLPFSVTINRVKLESGEIIQILAEDISTKPSFQKETDKNQLEEMATTLKNVMRFMHENTSNVSDIQNKLSPTESKVCKYIQQGKGTKEIAEELNLSIDTIQTHRKNIRKKLGLRGKNISLFSCLNSSQHDLSD